jgi:hypothetical protein
MKAASAIDLPLSMTVNANAFIASTDCRFGRSVGTCTTAVLRTRYTGPRIIRAKLVADTERDAPGLAFCKQTFRTDKLSITRDIGARSSCEHGCMR